MRFTELPLAGAFRVDAEPYVDERGEFARTYCARKFAECGLEPLGVQTNLSSNTARGTLRGMHMLLPPAGEAKLVRCVRGVVHDVIVDLRPASPTYLRHVALELSADNRAAVYVPRFFAHGFQTLADASEVFYQMSDFYQPGLEFGLRYDDPALGIRWPLPVSAISARDLAWQPLSEARVRLEAS